MSHLRIAVFHNLIIGGARRSLCEFVRFLARQNTVDLYVLSTLQPGLFDLDNLVHHIYVFEYKKLYLQPPFSCLNTLLIFINLYRLNRLYRKIAAEMDKKRYDVVFINPSFYDYMHIPGLIKYLDTPSVLYLYEPCRKHYEAYEDLKSLESLREKVYNLSFYHLYKLYGYLFKIYDLRNIKKSRLVLTTSSYAQKYISRVYSIFPKINYPGVDVEYFKPLPIDKENLVISIGHLEPRKGHDFVIRALANIPSRIRPKLAVIYPVMPGEGNGYRGYLEDLGFKMGVKVMFLKNIPDSELVILYNKAKITACAFINEPFGLVPLESMACQTPVVAINEAGLKETVIHNKTGLLTERNVTSFSEGIKYLLENEKISNEMGSYARHYVIENWSWEKAARELESNLSNVIKDA